MDNFFQISSFFIPQNKIDALLGKVRVLWFFSRNSCKILRESCFKTLRLHQIFYPNASPVLFAANSNYNQLLSSAIELP
ncbi:MAG: hypothetical protein EWV53_09150 [Microcystis panniformis Mp_MB_F_20051200_S9]|uniref:Uncharacterized protein n=1 Tax=Microcystis panniformis Mp_MB_F_20051200_S9 TaxID=2486223 RepID=A0A552Q1P8_9CHRO|nr:MAG: hypothetical protein EWV42_15205 [Microcystis panniformis Mp_GB_SS_20050300_S99D]TRV53055.1 MAG: hypothetical protein EWV43_00690 [Microcystis panniformis Mp_MB_F_20080800_S26D]TRV56061.1 MAG: hypothetical protein EWV69_19060 [Microcystis panniformis Mp_MB_F_20080800_S26]TRV63136.1 MAG: hypothetical protein EWV53_09150 [Microcystis panniformis Mp_MB_F_20051200_S9]TRV68938.1 MAG: hypothetical protein EWV51_19355 [Microcystis panniformis Mp_MB_F_20051200_S6]TRV69547.1 MAG: hypothetical p